MTKNVTIIIPRWNCNRNVIECIKSIKEKTSYPNYRIIVIDDFSDEDDVGWVWLKENETKELDILLRNEKNLGVVKNLNKGVKLAGWDDCIYVDSDSKVLTTGWIWKFRELIEEYPKYLPSAVITYSDGVNIKHPARNFKSIDENENVYKPGTPVESIQRITPVSWIPSAAVYLTRELINKIFPLDEHYTWGWLDPELSLSCLQAGYQPVYFKDVIAWHGISGGGYKNNKIQRAKDKIWEKDYKYFQEKWKDSIDRIIGGIPRGNI